MLIISFVFPFIIHWGRRGLRTDNEDHFPFRLFVFRSQVGFSPETLITI